MAESDMNEKAMAGLLRNTLARASEAGGPGCPAPEILAAYYERSLNATESAQAEEHFASCARCQEELAAMVRAEPPGKKAEQAGWNWNAMWRVLTPLAVAAAVVAIWVALRPSLQRPREVSKSETEVAQTTNPRTLSDAPVGPANGRTAATEQAPSSSTSSVKKLEAGSAGLDLKKKKSEKKEGRDDFLGGTLGALNAPVTPAAGSGGAISTNRIAANSKQGNEALFASQSPAAKTPAKGEVSSPAAEAEKSSPTAAPAPAPSAAFARTLPPMPPRAPSTGAVNGLPGGALAGSVAKESANEPVTTQTTQLDSNLRSRSRQHVLVNAQPIDFLSSQFKVASPDPNVIWRAGAAGTIELSKNGGKTWQGQFLNMKLVLVAGMAPSEKVCWLVGNDGAVLRTTDGITWKKVATPAAVNLVSVTAEDAERAIVTAADGRTFSTEDGGKTWKAN